MESTGFILGIMGFVFGAAALNQISSLKKEFEKLKKGLGGSGVLKTQAETEEN